MYFSEGDGEEIAHDIRSIFARTHAFLCFPQMKVLTFQLINEVSMLAPTVHASWASPEWCDWCRANQGDAPLGVTC